MIIPSVKSFNLLSNQALTALANSFTLDIATKEVALQTTKAQTAKLKGEDTIPTWNSGKVQVSNNGGPAAEENQRSLIDPAVTDANGATLLNDSETNPTGAPVYAPGTVPPDTSSGDISDMASEVNEYYSAAAMAPKPSGITLGKIASYAMAAANLAAQIASLSAARDAAINIVEKRATGELPNPVLNFSAIDLEELPPSSQEKITAAMDTNEEIIKTQIIAPFVENQRLLKTLKAQVSGTLSDVDPIFDLDFGPPISTSNQFVLSRDGLYYNSRTSDVPVILPDPVTPEMANLQYASNIGGRGLSFTEEDAESTVDSIFDLNRAYEKENPRVDSFIKYDDVVQQFKDDKMSHMSEVSGYIAEVLSNGYGSTDAIVQSYTAQLGAVASVYDSKIKKRTRQLTIAALFGRDAFIVTNRTHPLGEGMFFQYEAPRGKAFEYKLQYDDLTDALKSSTFYTLEGGQTVLYNTKTKKIIDYPDTDNILALVGYWKEIPRIPINDFSYLKQSDIPLRVQKKLTLFSEDLDTIIAPYQAKYVVAPANQPMGSIGNLGVDPIGLGDWTHRQTSASLSATTPLYKSLTDDIVSDGLLICYNFLDPDAVTQPSGTLYALNNAAEGSDRMDGKLVGYDKSLVFPSGVGQAYFGGTIFDEQASMNTTWEDIKGSYVRLPNSTKNYNILQPNLPFYGVRPLDNLFYSQEGVTLDFWAYVPNVHTDMTDNHRYRLVLASENSGPTSAPFITGATQSNVSQGKGLTAGGTNFSRTIGMIMGWRDRGSPKGTTPGAHTWYSSGLEFCIAPTVGQNQSYATTPDTTWGHSVCIAEKWDPSAGVTPQPDQITQVGMFIPSSILTSSGFGIKDVSSAYHHINVSFDYKRNKVDFNFDGELLTTSSLSNVFGGNPDDTVLPTAVQMKLEDESAEVYFNDPMTESFLGNTVYDERCTPERVAFPVFTPWIIGGGYSDNIPIVPGTNYRPQGFLGSNTNNIHQNTQYGASVSSITIGTRGDYIVGQHTPPLSGGKGGSASDRKKIPRSGLDGFVGSFKIYARPLTTSEAKRNFDSQKGFFQNILIPTP